MPDDLFEAAESARTKLGLSRDEFYAQALRRYVGSRADDDFVTARLNEVYSDAKASRLDPEIVRYQAKLLPEDDW